MPRRNSLGEVESHLTQETMKDDKLNEEEFRIEARRRGYGLVAFDRIKIVNAKVEFSIFADAAQAVSEADLIDSLGREIAAKLVEFRKVEIGPVDKYTRTRTARAQFAVIVPRTPRRH